MSGSRSGRIVENILALMGGFGMTLALCTPSLRDLGFTLGECVVQAQPRGIPWELFFGSFALVVPKTISRASGADFFAVIGRAIAARISGGRSIEPPPPADPTAEEAVPEEKPG